MGKYDDILYREHPTSKKHVRMDLNNRAKIFLPFAALKGYEEEIISKQQMYEQKRILSSSQKEEINAKLLLCEQLLETKQHPYIQVEYFEKKPDSVLGNYYTIQGSLLKMDKNETTIKIGNTSISFSQIFSLEGELFE